MTFHVNHLIHMKCQALFSLKVLSAVVLISALRVKDIFDPW